jgi:hypothetical protein
MNETFTEVIVEDIVANGYAVSDGFALAKYLLSKARSLTRLTIKSCNQWISERDAQRIKKLQHDIKQECKRFGIVPYFNGDPRGCVVKLKLHIKYDSWDGEHYCVPAKRS